MGTQTGNGAGLIYTDGGLLSIDTGDGLAIINGKLVATGSELDPSYKDYLDKKLAEEFDSKFQVTTVSANPLTIERGQNTNVTISVTCKNDTGKAVEYLKLSIGGQEVTSSTGTTISNYQYSASATFTATAELKLQGYATKKTNSRTVNAYYPIYTGVSKKETLDASDFGTTLQKTGIIKASAVGKYNYTIEDETGAYPYLAVPFDVTLPTHIMAGFPTDVNKQTGVSVNGVSYTILRPLNQQKQGQIEIEYIKQ